MDTPQLDKLTAIGARPPKACAAGWCGYLLRGAPGHHFPASLAALCLQSSAVELALILYYDGLAYRPGLN